MSSTPGATKRGSVAYFARKSAAGKLAHAKLRDKKAATRVHPKDAVEIRVRAGRNVLDDLRILVESARERMAGEVGPRVRLLAQEELGLLDRAVIEVEAERTR